jgi:hypothetical protein
MIITAGILIWYLFTNPNAKSSLMSGFFAFAFAFDAIVFFLIFANNSIATFIGAPLFIILAILFSIDIFANKLEYRLPETRWIKYSTVVWILLVFLYPIIGMVFNHYYPETCTPVMPCPLTVLAIAMVTAALPRIDKKILVLLLPWALLGLPKCLGVYGCYEDCILFSAGVYGLIMFVLFWKRLGKPEVGLNKD